MILTLILMPVVAAIALFASRSRAASRVLPLGCALAHLALSVACWRQAPAPALGGWLVLDPIGKLFLLVISVVFFMGAIYAAGFPGTQAPPRNDPSAASDSFQSEPIFNGCLLMLLGTMTLVTASQHLGLLWVAIEGTTLASTPLIYLRRDSRSLEATWKYLLICSVGIALALLGNFFLEVAAAKADGVPNHSMVLSEVLSGAAHFDKTWVKAAFILLLIGYGTKMGLAPMHTWLPDAYSESPSPAAPLLSGALINCAFIGVLRAQQVCAAAGLAPFGEEAILALGLLSMAVAAVFILGQTDYKRLLAYSSVENVGIMAVGLGLGGAGAFGSLLHAVNHSFAKAMLFFIAGNLLFVYQTRAIAQVRGLLHRLPFSGVLWLTGFLAITGTPPFGTFVSEFSILKSAVDQGRLWVAAMFLGLLGVIFIGMATAFLGMAQGEAEKETRTRLSWMNLAPPLGLGALVLTLGLYLPPSLTQVLRSAAQSLGGL
jgi:hydrogenase-4 component F